MRTAIRVAIGLFLTGAIALGLGTFVPRPFLMASAGIDARGAGSSVERTVLVISSQIHTDIAFSADPDVIERFSFMAREGLDPSWPGVSHIVAGWGGRSFYIETPTWSDLKPGPVFKALTVDSSVMHMSLAGPIDPAHPKVAPVTLDGPAFERLLDAVAGSFVSGPDGQPLVVEGAHYGPNDLFFESHGRFNVLAGCNVWTARMLREAGVSTGWWTPLPGLLIASLKLHNADGVVGQVPGER